MITIRKSADTDLVRQLKNSNGAVVDLTDASYSCDLRETPTSSASVSATPATFNTTYGIYKIPIQSSTLTNLGNKLYYCRSAITIGTADYDDSFYVRILDNTGITISTHLVSGTTAERPTLTSADTGFTYYDTDLGVLIVWTGTAWDTSVGDNFRGSYTTAEIALLDTSGYTTADWVFDTDLLSPYWWDGTEWR